MLGHAQQLRKESRAVERVPRGPPGPAEQQLRMRPGQLLEVGGDPVVDGRLQVVRGEDEQVRVDPQRLGEVLELLGVRACGDVPGRP